MDFNNYSDFCRWLADSDEYNAILEYDDWSVVLLKDGRYFYYEHLVEGDSDSFFQVVPIADLHYSVLNDIKLGKGETLDYLFDCDICGEQVKDEEIVYGLVYEKRKQDEKKLDILSNFFHMQLFLLKKTTYFDYNYNKN